MLGQNFNVPYSLYLLGTAPEYVPVVSSDVL